MNWLISLLVGIGVGMIYGLSGVRSPAPPVVALIGLLGMLGGEHLAAFARYHIVAPTAAASEPSTSRRRIERPAVSQHGSIRNRHVCLC